MPARTARTAALRADARRPGPTPTATAVAATANTPETVSCQLAGRTVIRASTKNRSPLAECRIAFHANAPPPAASPLTTAVIVRRVTTQVRSATTTTVKAAPYAIVP